MKIFEIIAPLPPPTPLAIFSLFYPLPVKLKGESDPAKQCEFKLWKLIKEPNLEHLKANVLTHLQKLFCVPRVTAKTEM